MSQHDITSINSQSNTSISTSSNKGTENTSHMSNMDVGVLPSELSQETSFLGNNNNLRILYITLAIIIGILLLWIVIVIFTKEDPLKILNEMTDLTKQLAPVSDMFPVSSISNTSQQLPQTIDITHDPTPI